MQPTRFLSTKGRRLLMATAVVGVTAAVTNGSASAAGSAAPFLWPGVYDLIGTGFPEGPREAVLQIDQTDSTYALVALKGPPGMLVSFKVTGDSAHVIWDLGSEPMFVDLRGTGDSLRGAWSTSEMHGEIRGARRH